MSESVARRVAKAVLARRATVASPSELMVPTVVVAPHPDDETLGCGALIAAKRRLGAEVAVVFLTDGAASHPRFGSDRLRALRRQEGLAACAELGVAEDAVSFLDRPDGRLARHVDDAGSALGEILAERRPIEVLVTAATEPHRDHAAAFRVVAAAVRGAHPQPQVRQYPVWLWNHWPWVRWSDVARDRRGRLTPGQWRRSLALLPAWSEFDWAVPIGDLAATKRAALACHGSQIGRLDGRDDWVTLADISEGRFLECFFDGYELFSSTPVPSDAAAQPGDPK